MKKLTKRSTKVSLRVAMSILLALVLAMSGVGIYFAFRKPEAPTPEIKVNPLEFSVDAWDGSSESEDQFINNFGGRGDNTITIDSAKSFVYFVNQVNSGKTFEGKTIFLNSSIDLKGHSIDPIGKGVNKFKGTFNGGYYTIMNANINGSGLFENVENATIKNLGVYNVNINSVDVAGGLVGKATDTTIENVFVRLGSINGALVGGLVGEFVSSTGEHSISNSFADTTMVGLTVGGLIGKLITINPISISYSYYTSGNMAVATYAGEGEYIDYVTEEKVELATAETDFTSWGYSSEYKETSTWCDYAHAEDSTELSFNYPLLAKFVRVYLQGSVYEGVLVDGSGNAIDDVETLEDAVDKINLGGIASAEINIIVEKIFADEIKFESESTVTVKPAKNTTIVRAKTNELSIFATTAESKATLILGEKAEENETVPTMVIDGNREYVEANQLDSGAAISALGADFEMNKNVVVQNNINNTTNYGGGVFTAVDAENINLNGTVTACSSGLYGGGVCVLGKATLSMEIFGCVSDNGGGAAAVNIIEDNESAEQIASLYGSKRTIQPLTGQLVQGGGSFNLGGNYIYMNHSTSSGGGVYAGYVWFIPDTVCQIHHNSAMIYGGGLCVNNSLTMKTYAGEQRAFTTGFVNISYNRLYVQPTYGENHGGAGIYAGSAYLNDAVLMRGNIILDYSWWRSNVGSTDATALNGYGGSNMPGLLRQGVGNANLYSTTTGVVLNDEFYDKMSETDSTFDKLGEEQYFETLYPKFINRSSGASVGFTDPYFSSFTHQGAAIRVAGSLTTYASIWSHTLLSPGSLIYKTNSADQVIIAGDVKTNYANLAQHYGASQYSYLLYIPNLSLANVRNHAVNINIHSSVTGLVARMPSRDKVNYNIRMVNAPDVTASTGVESLTIREGDVYGDISGVANLTVTGGRIRSVVYAYNTNLDGRTSQNFLSGNILPKNPEFSIVVGGSSKSDMPSVGVAFDTYHGNVVNCTFNYCQVGVADAVTNVDTYGFVNTSYVYPTDQTVTDSLFNYCRVGAASRRVYDSIITNKYDTVTGNLNDSYGVWMSQELGGTTVSGYSSVYGGAVSYDITFTGCTFINNTKIIDQRTNSNDITVTFNGGLYGANGTDMITKDTTISVMNYAPAIVSVKNYVVSAGTFKINVGPMFYHNGNASITGGEFTEHTSGVLVPEGTLWISGGTFAQNSNFNGGVAQIPYGATVNIASAEDGTQPLFFRNTATEYGGVFDVQGTLNVYAGEFNQNSAGLGGAAISQADDSTLYMNNGTFTNNNSSYGTILAKNMGIYGQTDKNSVVFENNTSDYGTVVFAGMHGGGNNAYDNDFVFENVTFRNNNSTYLNQAPIYLFDVTPKFKIGVGVAIENENENTTDIYMDDLNNNSYTQYITAMGSSFYQSYKVYKAGLQQYLGSINDRNTVVYFGNGYGTASSFPVQIMNSGLSATYMEDRVVATGKSALPSYSYARDNYNFAGYNVTGISSYDPIKINGNSDEMAFTGAEYVMVGSGTDDYCYTDKFTISLWAYMDNWAEYADDSQRIISNNYNGLGWSLASINGYVGLDFANYEDIVSPTIHWSHLTDGWHRFMVVFDGANFYLYVDGVLIGHTIATATYGQYSNYFIGCEAEVNGKFFHGKVKQLYILNEVLRPEDTYFYDNLATQGYTKVNIENNFAVTTECYPYLSGYKDLGGSYEFSDKMTMSVWASMPDWRWYATDARRLIGCSDVWSISANDAGYFRFDAYDVGSEQWRSIDTTIRCMDLSAGWHNFVMVFNGKTVTAYIDGIRIGISSTFTGELGGNRYSSANVVVGAMGDSSSSVYWNEFGGKIKDLYILNKALSEEELFGTRQHYGTKLFTTTSMSADAALSYSQWNKALHIYTHDNCSHTLNYGFVDHSKLPEGYETCLYGTNTSSTVSATGTVTSITADNIYVDNGASYTYRIGYNTYTITNGDSITLSSSNVTLYANNYISLYLMDTTAPTITNFTITETPLTTAQIKAGKWGAIEYSLSWERDDWCDQEVEVYNQDGDLIYESSVSPDDTYYAFYSGQLFEPTLHSQYFGLFTVKLILIDGSGNSSYATIDYNPSYNVLIDYGNYSGDSDVINTLMGWDDSFMSVSSDGSSYLYYSNLIEHLITRSSETITEDQISIELINANGIQTITGNVYLPVQPGRLRISISEQTSGGTATEYAISYTAIDEGSYGFDVNEALYEYSFAVNPTTYDGTTAIQLKAPIIRPGYSFCGWIMNYNGAIGPDYYITEIPAGTTGDISLTAVLDCGRSYLLTFYTDESQIGTSDYFYQYSTSFGSSVEVTPSVPTKDGYKFLGWQEGYQQFNEDTRESEFVPVGSYPIKTIVISAEDNYYDRYYTAMWAQEYTITYSANYYYTYGFDISYALYDFSFNVNPTTYDGTEDITLRVILKPGFSLYGWYDGENFVSSTIPAGTTGNLTRIAVIECPSSTANLHFFSDESSASYGTNNMSFTYEVPFASNVNYTPTYVPTKSGYICVGWQEIEYTGDYTYDDNTGTGVYEFEKVGPDSLTQININCNVYDRYYIPVWKEAYTITYDLEGGCSEDDYWQGNVQNPSAQKAVYGQTITLATPELPSKYTSGYWKSDVEADTESGFYEYQFGEVVTIGSYGFHRDITLTFVPTGIASISVTYIIQDEYIELNSDSDANLKMSNSDDRLQIEGYTFKYWKVNINDEFNGDRALIYYYLDDLFFEYGNTYEITAVFEAEAPGQYTVTYNLNGYASFDGETESYTISVTEGSTIKLVTPTPKEVYYEMYWTKGGQQYDCGQSITVTSDMVFELGVSINYGTQNFYDEDGTLLLSVSTGLNNVELPTPTKANNGRIGYTFKGWAYEYDYELFNVYDNTYLERFYTEWLGTNVNFYAVYEQKYINTLFVVETAEGGTTNVTGQFTVDGLNVTMNVDDDTIEVGDKEIVATANDSTVFLYWSIRTDHATETVYITPVFAGEDEVEEIEIVKVNALNQVAVDLYSYNSDTTNYDFVQSYVVPLGQESGSFKVMKNGNYKVKYSANLSYVSSTETHQILNLYDGSSKIATTSSAHNTQYLSELKNMSSNVITFKFFNAYALNKNDVSISNVIEGMSIATANNDTLDKTEDINMVLKVNDLYVIKEGTVYSISVSTSTLTGVTKSYSYLGYDYTLNGSNGSASYNGGVTSYIDYKGFVVNPGVTANANDVGATGTYTYEVKATAKLTRFVIKLVENVDVSIDVDTIVDTETTNNVTYQVTLTSADNLIKTFTSSTIQNNGLTLYKSTWSVVVSGGNVSIADVRSWFTTSSSYTITVQEGASANTFVVIIA